MEILLQKNELLDLGAGLRNVEIICRSGRCWLTQTGDLRDHVLSPGKRMRVCSRGRVLVTASAECRLLLLAPAVGAAASFWRQLCNNN